MPTALLSILLACGGDTVPAPAPSAPPGVMVVPGAPKRPTPPPAPAYTLPDPLPPAAHTDVLVPRLQGWAERERAWPRVDLFRTEPGRKVRDVVATVVQGRLHAVLWELDPGAHRARLLEVIDGGEPRVIVEVGELGPHPRLHLRRVGPLVYFASGDTEQRVVLGAPGDPTQGRPVQPTRLWPAVVSPDEAWTAHARDTTLVIESDSEARTLVHQPYDGDWSIEGMAWRADSQALYFDNSGAVACIWRATLDGTVTKIVPEHEAVDPNPVDLGPGEHVVYHDTHAVRLAWSGASDLGARLSPDLEALAGTWVRVVERDGTLHRVTGCTHNPGQMWIVPEHDRLMWEWGQETLFFAIVAARSEDGPPRWTLDVVSETGGQSVLHVARTEGAGVLRIGGLGQEGLMMAEAAARALPTYGEDCSEYE